MLTLKTECHSSSRALFIAFASSVIPPSHLSRSHFHWLPPSHRITPSLRFSNLRCPHPESLNYLIFSPCPLSPPPLPERARLCRRRVRCRIVSFCFPSVRTNCRSFKVSRPSTSPTKTRSFTNSSVPRVTTSPSYSPASVPFKLVRGMLREAMHARVLKSLRRFPFHQPPTHQTHSPTDLAN